MKTSKKNMKIFVYTICVVTALLLVSSIVVVYYIFVPFSNATDKYNEAAKKYNAVIDKYNEKSKLGCLQNLSGCCDRAEEIPIVDMDSMTLSKSFFSGNTANKINSDTETINQMTSQLQSDLLSFDYIINPDAEKLMNVIKDTDKITDIDCITESKKLNYLLGEDSGCTGCIYFSFSDIDNIKLSGSNVIERGTDGGGSIEIYSTEKEALSRCEYLKDFDNTALYSGSYVVVGTLVIRTSYLLNNEQQNLYTEEIVNKIMSCTLTA